MNTEKRDLFTHLEEMHGGTYDYRGWTYRGMQNVHLQDHHGKATRAAGYVKHHHVAMGLDAAEYPEGWNDGGCRYTAVRAREEV